jgi:hypothetical protein
MCNHRLHDTTIGDSEEGAPQDSHPQFEAEHMFMVVQEEALFVKLVIKALWYQGNHTMKQQVTAFIRVQRFSNLHKV